MIKILLKKQITEIFRSYFFNPKTNKMRSKLSTAMYIVLFLLIMVVFLGGMFGSLAYMLCGALASQGLEWVYFSLFSVLALALGVFGSVFNTYSGLYLSKDNDLLLSMPIPAKAIVFSRLMSVYIMGLMYSSVVLIPAMAVYVFVEGFSLSSFFGCIMLLVVMSLIILVLACALGWVVAKASLKLKNKSFTIVIISLVFIGVYYFAVFKVQNLINSLIFNAAQYGDGIKKYAYPVYLLGKMGEGSIVSILIITAVTAALTFVTWKILLSSFFDIATTASSGASNTNKKQKTENYKEKSAFLALFSKEFARFKSSPTYMLNCGLGTLLIPVGAVALLIKGGELLTMTENMMTNTYDSLISIIAMTIICVVATMNDTVVPSVSLEGKTLWIVQSLPVSMKDVLLAKIGLQLSLTLIPVLFFGICASIALKIGAFNSVALILCALSFCFAYAFVGMILALSRPNLNWTNEITPIKQNVSVLISIFGGWGYAVIAAGGYMLLGLYISAWEYMLTVTIINVLITVLSYRRIIKVGTRTMYYL